MKFNRSLEDLKVFTSIVCAENTEFIDQGTSTETNTRSSTVLD
jgi:hypothetical protein